MGRGGDEADEIGLGEILLHRPHAELHAITRNASAGEEDEAVDAGHGIPFDGEILDHRLDFVPPLHPPSTGASIAASFFVSSFQRKYPSPSAFSSSL